MRCAKEMKLLNGKLKNLLDEVVFRQNNRDNFFVVKLADNSRCTI